MIYGLMALAAAIIVALDQLTKYLVLTEIPLHGYVQAIPGLFHFTYIQNDGAAFSMLRGQQWLFPVLFLVLFAIAKKERKV